MKPKLNFILGAGERLTEPIPAPGRMVPDYGDPYSQEEARRRLSSPAHRLVKTLDKIPKGALTENEAIAVVTLHPQYLSKSAYPAAALAAAGLRDVGSRGSTIKPDRWTRKVDPFAVPTTQLFIAGDRESFRGLSAILGGKESHPIILGQLTRIEDISAQDTASRVRISETDRNKQSATFEVVSHEGDSEVVLRSFKKWARSVGAKADFDRKILVPGLGFIPVSVPLDSVDLLATFSFLRAVRSMPRLRGIRTTVSTRTGPTQVVQMPPEGPLDNDLRVAVFDGGLMSDGPLAPWANALESKPIGPADVESLIHGHRVTSAILFGPLEHGGVAPRPYAHVDHYRVLDDSSDNDPEDLFDVLPRILNVLYTRKYDYVNLSLGPDLPIEDDDPHAWTVALDDYLSDGSTLMTVSVGNRGALDRASGNARIQPPADCVNALGVGAANSSLAVWNRAEYSCVGPGRSPGVVKPDILGFGGDTNEPFEVLDWDSAGRTIPTQGTSFAAPAAMRLALGLRALLGTRLSPLAGKALLVHCSQRHATVGHDDVGWGRIPDRLEEIAICPDGSVRVLYQGFLDPAGYVRMQVPLPVKQLAGMVTIAATIAYAAPVNGSHMNTYTKAGLDIVFRPHSGKFGRDGTGSLSQTKPFFQKGIIQGEEDLRADAHTWETVRHRSLRMRGTSLQAPVFDIHYNAREAGHAGTSFSRIPYAGVITVKSPRSLSIYDDVMKAYVGQLQAFAPMIDIPLQVQT